MRLASVHIEKITNVRHAVSHSARTELSAPSYLLPKKFRKGNTVHPASLSEDAISALHDEKMINRSGKAKADKSVVFHEAVIVLPDFDIHTNAEEYRKNQIQALTYFKREFSRATGCTVLHMSIHLDEGTVIDGTPIYNPHAHFIYDRTYYDSNQKLKMCRMNKMGLSAIQVLASKCFGMALGNTFENRKLNGDDSAPRPHIPHNQYRAVAELKKVMENIAEHEQDANLSDVSSLDLNTTASRVSFAVSSMISRIKAQAFSVAELIKENAALLLKINSLEKDKYILSQQLQKSKEVSDITAERAFSKGYEEGVKKEAEQSSKIDGYLFLRGYLKATKRARQSDYQTLKIMHEMQVDLSVLIERAENETDLVFEPIRLLTRIFEMSNYTEYAEHIETVLRFKKEDFEKGDVTRAIEREDDRDGSPDFSPF